MTLLTVVFDYLQRWADSLIKERYIIILTLLT